MYAWIGGPAPSTADRLADLCLDLMEALASADAEALAPLLAEKARLLEDLAVRGECERESLVRARERLMALQACIRPMLRALGLDDPRNTYGPGRSSYAPPADGLLVRASR